MLSDGSSSSCGSWPPRWPTAPGIRSHGASAPGLAAAGASAPCSPARAAPARPWPPRSWPTSWIWTCIASICPAWSASTSARPRRTCSRSSTPPRTAARSCSSTRPTPCSASAPRSRTAHDRYANIEVNYLLQRMEDYRGLAILATNRKSALDHAFLRRLRFLVTFPFPDADSRQRIWQKVFPRQRR